MTNASEIDPNAIVLISDYSNDSLRLVAERLEHSTRFQHYILRADELDALWRHLDAAIPHPFLLFCYRRTARSKRHR